MNAQLDLGPVKERNADLIMRVVELTLLRKTPTPDEGMAFWKNLITALTDTCDVIGEVERLREGRQRARDIHIPQASADPAVPGAVCTGCSVHGALVAWPCATWKALDGGR